MTQLITLIGTFITPERLPRAVLFTVMIGLLMTSPLAAAARFDLVSDETGSLAALELSGAESLPACAAAFFDVSPCGILMLHPLRTVDARSGGPSSHRILRL